MSFLLTREDRMMTTSETFGFEQSVNFFNNHQGDTYIAPEKAGANRDLMLALKDDGTKARYNFIGFAQKLSAGFIDLKYDNTDRCSRWWRNDGRGQPMVIHNYLWIQLKNPKWRDQLPSVSLSFGADNCLDIRVDVDQDNLSKLNKENPKLYKKILEQQFHLLDILLKDNIEYRIREERYHEYGNLDVEAIKEKYENSETKPLIQVGTRIESLFEKDNDGVLLDETIEAVRVIKSYYDFVMTYDEEKCIDKAESIDEEIDNLHLKGEDREAVVNLRVNQNVFRDHLLAKHKHCCMLCGVDQTELLVASHIKPWSKSLPEEKLDVDNGLLMCPSHDRLFDRGFISFDDDGKILISSSLTDESRAALGITKDMKINLSEKNKVYLQYHRNEIFRK